MIHFFVIFRRNWTSSRTPWIAEPLFYFLYFFFCSTPSTGLFTSLLCFMIKIKLINLLFYSFYYLQLAKILLVALKCEIIILLSNCSVFQYYDSISRLFSIIIVKLSLFHALKGIAISFSLLFAIVIKIKKELQLLVGRAITIQRAIYVEKKQWINVQNRYKKNKQKG